MDLTGEEARVLQVLSDGKRWPYQKVIKALGGVPSPGSLYNLKRTIKPLRRRGLLKRPMGLESYRITPAGLDALKGTGLGEE